MIRTLIEEWTRGMVYRRSMMTAQGKAPIYASPSGGLKYLLKPMSQIDPQLMDFCDRYVQPGAVVWDMGANLGHFMVAAAAKVGSSGSIVAIEPDTWLVQLLQKTARSQRSSFGKMEVLPIGVASRTGFRRFAIAKRSRASNFLDGYGNFPAGGVREWITIPCYAADNLLEHFAVPQIVKVDVEGAELEFLEGAEELMTRHKPILHLEANEGTWQNIVSHLSERGYRTHDAELPGEQPVAWKAGTINIVAVPNPHSANHAVA